jgi:hypothetical protein
MRTVLVPCEQKKICTGRYRYQTFGVIEYKLNYFLKHLYFLI